MKKILQLALLLLPAGLLAQTRALPPMKSQASMQLSPAPAQRPISTMQLASSITAEVAFWFQRAELELGCQTLVGWARILYLPQRAPPTVPKRKLPMTCATI